MRALFAVTVVLAAAGAALLVLWPRSQPDRPSVCGPIDVAPAAVGVDAAGAATVCLLNQERARRGLPPLASDPRLAQAALEHSQDMVRRGYFEHTSPDGRTVQDRIRGSGWLGGRSASSTGENIEWGLRRKATPAAIVAAWMASPPHRADILRPAFTQIGIGIALGAPDLPGRAPGEGATYTTDFGGRFDPSLGSG